MQWLTKKHSIQLDLSSMIISLMILVWSTFYYFSTLTDTEEGPESVLFMRPVFFGILCCIPFVLRKTIMFLPRSHSDLNEDSENGKADRGLLEKHRIFFTLVSASYCVALPFLGYFISSALYVLICNLLLGSKNIKLLLALPVGISGLISIIFSTLLSIPIPIWPVW